MTIDFLCETSPNHGGNQSGTHGGAIAANARQFRVIRRKISPTDGRALELLGHAIEYLTDEYALSAAQAGTLETVDPRVEAVQTLMTLNRQVYYACPEIQPLLRRIGRWVFRAPATDAQSKQPLI
jgi:hypothetical protein